MELKITKNQKFPFAVIQRGKFKIDGHLSILAKDKIIKFKNKNFKYVVSLSCDRNINIYALDGCSIFYFKKIKTECETHGNYYFKAGKNTPIKIGVSHCLGDTSKFIKAKNDDEAVKKAIALYLGSSFDTDYSHIQDCPTCIKNYGILEIKNAKLDFREKPHWRK